VRKLTVDVPGTLLERPRQAPGDALDQMPRLVSAPVWGIGVSNTLGQGQANSGICASELRASPTRRTFTFP
jgi:hypothetical protein